MEAGALSVHPLPIPYLYMERTMISLIELEQIIQDYFPERIRLGTLTGDVKDIADLYKVKPILVARAINSLAYEVDRD